MNRNFTFMMAAGAMIVLAIGRPGFPPSTSVDQPGGGAGSRGGSRPTMDSLPQRCYLTDPRVCQTCDKICPAQKLLDTTEAYFLPRTGRQSRCHVPAAPAAAKDKAKQKADLDKHWGVPPDVRSQVRFLIALVFDPAHTHMSLFFDRQIETIEQAAAQSGYFFSRATMPWEAKGQVESPEWIEAMFREKFQQAREDLPGLMVFHQDFPEGDPDACDQVKPLFVYVVGETSTGGVNKAQFRNSLQAIHDINDGLPPQLGIIGPGSSGSLYSLDGLLQEAQVPESVIIHSGTISSYAVIDWFNQRQKSRQQSKTRPPGPRRKIVFRSFQEGDLTAVRRFLDYLGGLGYQERDVAVLSEDETAYGIGNPTILAPVSEVLQLYFPRDISQLRSAYQRAAIEGSSSAKEARKNHPSLRSNIEDSGSDDDSAPRYAHAQTPLSQEAILTGLVATLHRHESRFVVLRASNPLDQLFLTRYLRAALPETRIVTISADLLLQREADNPDLHGVLAISSYALMPGLSDVMPHLRPLKNQRYLRRDAVFPTSYSVGTFNAMLSLLSPFVCQDQHLREVDCNMPLARPIDTLPVGAGGYAGYGLPCFGGGCGDPSHILSPPLWLSILGPDGFSPVDLLSVDSSIPKLNGSFEPGAYPELPTLMPWAILCLLSGMAVAGYLYLAYSGRLSSNLELPRAFAPVPGRLRTFLLCVIQLGLVVLLLLAIVPTVHWLPLLPFVGCAAPLLTLLLVLIFFGWALLSSRGARHAALVFVNLSLLLVVAAELLLLRPRHFVSDFRFWRYVHLFGGISPLLPVLLLLVAGMWWAWQTLDGLSVYDTGKPALPPAASLDLINHPRFRALSQEENPWLLLSEGKRWARWRNWMPSAGFVGLTAILFATLNPLRSMEGRAYDLLYSLALLMIVFLLLLTVSQLFLAWIHLHTLLTRLDRLPLRRRFARLGGMKWAEIWRLGGQALRESPLVMRQMEAMQRLHKACEPAPTTDRQSQVAINQPLRRAIQAQLTWAEGALETVRQDIEPFLQSERAGRNLSGFVRGLLWLPVNDTGGQKNLLGRLGDFHHDLAKAAGTVLQALESLWKNESPEKLHQAPPASDEERRKPDGVPAVTRIAEEFVCRVYLNTIVSMVLHTRNMVFTIAGMYFLILISVICYPFQPSSAIRGAMTVLAIMIGLVVIYVLGAMHRDATLSYITETTPDSLGIEFWVRLAMAGALPLLGLIAAQFPGLGGMLSWLQPALEAAK